MKAKWLFALPVLVLLVGCSPALPSGAPVPADPRIATHPAPAEHDDSAPRSGTLRQSQISVRMTAGDLAIELTPLAPWVLEAAAPDTQARLARIAETHREELARLAGEAALTLFLVSFSGARPGIEFEPHDLHLVSRGLRKRPAAVRGISPGWGSNRIDQQRASLTGIFAYPGSVDLTRALTVSYQGEEDRSWARAISRIEAERERRPTLDPGPAF